MTNGYLTVIYYERIRTMPRYDIWQNGVKTQFSRDNQPQNRGRKKGQPNRATIFKAVMIWLREHEQAIEKVRRDSHNARRRERYAQKKRAGGTTHPTQ
ncbi:hypothetical protein SAMN06269250_5288 [Spirosoma fluviale]|uniref:Uncharacterized protein n=1 Tax=Spirosoma fluviale TaxID=1597977 RepID=A0A286GMI5_9BACT|nr:hypothetical protein SAMN06269250_5288 [Spirosoma fluviale]